MVDGVASSQARWPGYDSRPVSYCGHETSEPESMGRLTSRRMYLLAYGI
jgi:hypothetical protein